MDDLISRHDAIDAIERNSCNTQRAIDAVNALPSAQPERKKGKWIEHNPHKWGLGIVFECSECGEKIDCEPSNFCPNCGADMREDGAEQDG